MKGTGLLIGGLAAVGIGAAVFFMTRGASAAAGAPPIGGSGANAAEADAMALAAIATKNPTTMRNTAAVLSAKGFTPQAAALIEAATQLEKLQAGKGN